MHSSPAGTEQLGRSGKERMEGTTDNQGRSGCEILFVAHSKNDSNGSRSYHGLREHLNGVAQRAAAHARPFCSQDWGYLAGLWHDLGKYRPGFQSYVRLDPEAHVEQRLPLASAKTHSAAGALHALSTFEEWFGQLGAVSARALAYVIAGHHAGLADWIADLDARLLGTRGPESRREYDEARRACSGVHRELLSLPSDFDLRKALEAIPGIRSNNPLAASLWIRMLFSALVDADFLDTEAFMDGGRYGARSGWDPLPNYVSRLDAHLEAMWEATLASGRAAGAVAIARVEVLRQCRAKAVKPPGVFSLAVPTGGGKTLSSLTFALRHAVEHGKRRVIYAIPYTSIIEQTADVFAGIFGRDDLVEHHSQIESDNESARSRLACENWDAPLIVTTNVQLFESLFAARTSRCRKLHNIAGSVIVLDEAQLLPPEFLQPILDTLRLLVQHYGVTVLLCTATQPVLTDSQRFDPRQNLRGLPEPVPLMDDSTTLYRRLDRVRFEWPDDLHRIDDLQQVAAQVLKHDCVLTIVNTRRDASDLVAALDALDGDSVLHLSAAMCGQHRADVIREIRERLAARRMGADPRPLRVVSTQLVEAGVDIDFPVVFRSLAGLDSLAQAAGRCNREGLLEDKGRVVVFVRDIPPPLTALRAGVQATRSVLGPDRPASLSPDLFERYFPLYYDGFRSRDGRGIVDLLRNDSNFSFQFRRAAREFRLIDDDDQATVVVPYDGGMPAQPVRPLIGRLSRPGEVDRWLMRALQRYTVTVRRRQIDVWQERGAVREVQPGVFLLVDEVLYDMRRGLLVDGQPLSAASLVQ